MIAAAIKAGGRTLRFALHGPPPAIFLPWATASGRIHDSRDGPCLVTYDGGRCARFGSIGAAQAVRDHLDDYGHADASIRVGANRNDRTRDRQLIALRLASPKRAAVDQADAAHLPLFTAANEPRLI